MKTITIRTNADGQKKFYDFMKDMKLNMTGLPELKIDGDFLTIGNVGIKVYTDFNSEEIFVDSEKDLLKIKQLFDGLLKKPEDCECYVVPYDDILEGKKGCFMWYEDKTEKKEHNLQFSFQKHNRIQNLKNSVDLSEFLECLTDKSWHNLCDNPMTRQVGFANYIKSEARMFRLTFIRGIENQETRELFKRIHNELAGEV